MVALEGTLKSNGCYDAVVTVMHSFANSTRTPKTTIEKMIMEGIIKGSEEAEKVAAGKPYPTKAQSLAFVSDIMKKYLPK